MDLKHIEKKQTNSMFINYALSVFIFFILFEILIRAIFENTDNLMNIVKTLFSMIFLIYIVCVKRRITFSFKYIHMIFFAQISIILIKILKEGSITYFVEWVLQNNNINFFFWYIYFFIFSQLYEEIDIKKIIGVLRKYNYLIMTITFLLFVTNDYLGMVSYDNMLAYSWVGTSKSRVMSIYGNPNHAGLYFLIMLCILDYERIKANEKFVCLNNILLILFNIFTFSRTSIFSMIIYIFIRMKIKSGNNKESTIKVILNKYKIVLGILMSIPIILIIINKYNIYFFNIKDLVTNLRWEKWEIGIDYMINSPWIGSEFNQKIIGVSSLFEEISFSDNMFIEIGATFGIAILILVIAYILYNMFRVVKEKKYIKLNKLQIFIIPSILSGTIHFSIPVFIFIFYCMLCRDEI